MKIVDQRSLMSQIFAFKFSGADRSLLQPHIYINQLLRREKEKCRFGMLRLKCVIRGRKPKKPSFLFAKTIESLTPETGLCLNSCHFHFIPQNYRNHNLQGEQQNRTPLRGQLCVCVRGGVNKRVRKTLVCLLWTRASSSGSRVVKTYSSVLHEFKAGAEVCQADVTLLIQQNVVRLDVPEGGTGEEAERGETQKASCFRYILGSIHNCQF